MFIRNSKQYSLMVMNLWNNLALINISAPLCAGAKLTCRAVHKSHPWALKKAKLF